MNRFLFAVVMVDQERADLVDVGVLNLDAFLDLEFSGEDDEEGGCIFALLDGVLVSFVALLLDGVDQLAETALSPMAEHRVVHQERNFVFLHLFDDFFELSLEVDFIHDSQMNVCFAEDGGASGLVVH